MSFFTDVTIEITNLVPCVHKSDGKVTSWSFAVVMSKQGYVQSYEGVQEVEPTKTPSSYNLAEINTILNLEHLKTVFQSQYESTVGVSEADQVFDKNFDIGDLK